MALTVLPSKLLKKVASDKLVERLVNKSSLTVNRAALSMIVKNGVLTRKQAEDIALRVIKQYKKRIRLEVKAGENKATAKAKTINDKKLLVQRVGNATVNEITNEVKKVYRGERYVWLPSDAEEPDPQHQLKYGKTYTIGKGEMPGDRAGCKCGMRILVDDEDELLFDEAIGL